MIKLLLEQGNQQNTNTNTMAISRHVKDVSVSFVPLLLYVRGLFTWMCLCLELDEDDGVKKDQHHHRDYVNRIVAANM